MAQHADRIINNRRNLREFRQIVAAIIYHRIDPETEPQTRGFVCTTCRHTFELCTCAQERRTA